MSDPAARDHALRGVALNDVSLSASAVLIESVDALVACRDQGELANALASLAQRLLGTTEACVILRDSGQEWASQHPQPPAELASWAAALLAGAPQGRFVSSGPQLAAGIMPAQSELRGVLAVTLAQAATREQQSLLGALADLAATCSAQLERRIVADRRLQDTRAVVARGLHDLGTPLNSLRLGLHLLEPALTTKDPAVAQRTHRAVDRLASLVTSMSEALDTSTSGANNGARANASAAQH